jgi:hypothetical protein
VSNPGSQALAGDKQDHQDRAAGLKVFRVPGSNDGLLARTTRPEGDISNGPGPGRPIGGAGETLVTKQRNG